ncbi:SDR family NAD(P)-dependent oxidoreductase [Kitasatospora sp. NPDC101155]|uniref:SDR family NAD(P)-dependent oxidoreductase n=1 Tax=Kitasatospora sp. NPDC101155 TaxID=3364097 RepID=UPI0037F2E591
MSRSAPVVGGSRGIGLAVARKLAADGHRVAVTSRSGQAVEGLLAVQCDVTSPESVDRAFAEVEEQHGPVEILVVNAGITRDTLLLRMAEEDFDATLQTNLVGVYRAAKRASRGMLRRKYGRLVFISSAVAMTGEHHTITPWCGRDAFHVPAAPTSQPPGGGTLGRELTMLTTLRSSARSAAASRTWGTSTSSTAFLVDEFGEMGAHYQT